MRLVAAVQQIHSWKQWIEENRDEAKRLFPSALFSLHDSASFRFTIYIGRGENTANWLERRNFYSKEVGIEIRSFDAQKPHTHELCYIAAHSTKRSGPTCGWTQNRP